MSTEGKRENRLYNDNNIVISNDLALEIFSNSGIWFIITDQNGKFEYVSEGCKNTSGYSSKEFLTNPQLFEILVIPEDRDRYKTMSLNDRTSIRIINKNNEIKWVNLEVKQNIAHKNKQYKLLIISEETDNKVNENKYPKIEEPGKSINSAHDSSPCTKDIIPEDEPCEKTKDPQQCLFRIFNNVPVGIATLDMKGNISYCNPMLCEMYGYTKEELQQLNVFDLTFSEDYDYLKKQFSILSKEEQNHFKFIRKQRTKDNREIWIRASVFSDFSQDENHVPNLAIVEDISTIHQVKEALKISEKRFSWLLRFLPDIITIIDKSGNMIYNSPAYSQILGYTEEERTTGQVRDYVHPDDLDVFSQKFQEVINNPEKLIRHQYRFRHKNGDYKWIEAIASNQSSIIVSIERDVTNRKLMEDKLEETNQKLQTLNKTKDRLFSVIAHDLRTPFNSLIGLSEILLEKRQKTEQEELFLQCIHEISYETYELLENLLQWFRIQSNETKFNPIRLNWEQTLTRSIAFYKTQVIKKELLLSLNVTKNINVWADENMIRTVVRNLISNAIKFSNQKGSINITVEKSGLEIITCISDNGIGMSKSVLSQLFQTMHTSTHLLDHCSGLGLILCKEYIEQNNGRIWVESKPHQGSQFFFSLPAASIMKEDKKQLT